MGFRYLHCATIAAFIALTSSVALADGTVTADGTRTKVAGDRFIGIAYEVKSPRDLATGQATGKRQHQPLCMIKASSQATPQWFMAATTNEVLKSVVFETATLRLKLTNATVSEFKLLGAEGKETEQVCFTFDKIELSALKGGTTASDDWRAKM
jgi:type VI secretion system secreted protein Hcp